MVHGASGTPIAPGRYVPPARMRMRCSWSSTMHVPARALRRTDDSPADPDADRRWAPVPGTSLATTASVGPAAITIPRDPGSDENHGKHPAPMVRGVDDRHRGR